jgi:hypothetical protein
MYRKRNKDKLQTRRWEQENCQMTDVVQFPKPKRVVTRERNATENPAKSGNDPVTSANGDMLVTRGDPFCSVLWGLRRNLEPLCGSGVAQNRFTSIDEVV